jgi:hypothetical protein
MTAVPPRLITRDRGSTRIAISGEPAGAYCPVRSLGRGLEVIPRIALGWPASTVSASLRPGQIRRVFRIAVLAISLAPALELCQRVNRYRGRTAPYDFVDQIGPVRNDPVHSIPQ